MFKKVRLYWITAWVFSILFGEVITGLISGNPAFFKYWFAISLYYLIISFIAGWMFFSIKPLLASCVIFLYGGLAEVFFFKGIRIFPIAGLFYVFLFLAPYLFVRVLSGSK